MTGFPLLDKSASIPDLSPAVNLYAFSTLTLLEFPFVQYNSITMQYPIRFANNNNNDNDDPGIVGRSFAK
jgi:hypothetical protein